MLPDCSTVKSMNNLIICEKANAARRISEILSDGKAKKTSLHRVAVYDFELGERSYTVVGLRGHILALDYPEEYANWYRHPPGDLIRVKPIKKVELKSIARTLKELAREADEVVVATDFDREGELIGAESVEYIKEFNPDFALHRARFSALTREEITHAFDNLQEVDYNLSSAAESRQIIDLAWGAVLTRFISRTSGQTGKDFLSVGRVQSPTLALIVDREKEINDFVPTPFWEITANLGRESPLRVQHSNGKFKAEEPAREAFERANLATTALVVNVTEKERREIPPPPFNTTSFLKSTTSMGYSAAEAMRIAESLYIEGYMSYPRTDNTVYPPSLGLKALVEKFTDSAEFGELAVRLKGESNFVPTRGKKQATDHPPIHPVRPAPRGKLDDRQWKIFELVVRRFFATLAPLAISRVTRAEFDLNSEPFEARGIQTLKPGWRYYYPYTKRKDEELPALEKDSNIDVEKVALEEKETKPPSRYSEGSLIMLMEKYNLGTKSTRHEIIQKLYTRNYIEQKPPRPSLVGFSITDTLEKYAEFITRPEMTAILEKDMEEIAAGTKTLDEAVEESQQLLEKVMEQLQHNRDKISTGLRKAMQEHNTVGTCGKCGSALRMMRSRRGKRFVGCSGFPGCRESYPLPQSGKIVPTDEKCPACESPLITYVRAKRRPVRMCLNMQCPAREDWKARNGKKESDNGPGEEKADSGN